MKITWMLFLTFLCNAVVSQTLSTNTFSLPALTGNGPYDFTRITFPTPFPNGVTPIVVVSPTSTGSDEPITLRIININNTGFDVIQTEPVRTADSSNCGSPVSATTRCDGAHISIDASYLAVTAGTQTLSDGTVIIAGINPTNSVQHKFAGAFGTSITETWDDVNYGATFANSIEPVILSQIQSMNNETNLTLGSPNRMTGPSVPFMTAAIRNITTVDFDSSIELSEVDNGNNIFAAPITAQDEDIGWIAITNAVKSSITFDSTTLGFATSTFSDIRGLDNGCQSRTITAIPGTCSSPIVLANKNTHEGADGGWIRRCNLTTAPSGMGTDVNAGYFVDEDQDRDTERGHITEEVGVVVFCMPITLPVTIDYVKTTNNNSELTVEWSTSSETNSMSFEVWSKHASEWKSLGEPILSKATSSLTPNNYSFTYQSIDASDEIYIHQIDTDGTKEYFGPYKIGKKYGEKKHTKRIDWDSINANKTQLKSSNTSLKLNVKPLGKGLHRIHASQIPAFIGINKEDIALTLYSKAIGRHIGASSKFENTQVFSENDYIDFYAEHPINTDKLYLDRYTYQLSIDSDNAKISKNRSLSEKDNIESYKKQIIIEQNNHYDFASPMPEPWYQERMIRTNTDASATIEFDTPQVVDNTLFDLKINLYGVTDYKSYDTDGDGIINNDHHIVVYLNGHLIEDFEFDGHIKRIIVKNNLSSNILNQSGNELEINLINDTGYAYDIVNIDSVELNVQTTPISNTRNIHLTLAQSLDQKYNLQINNYPTIPDVIYAYKNKKLFKLNYKINQNNTLVIPVVNKALNYWISSNDHIHSVEIKDQAPVSELTINQNTNYLIISHPDFMNSSNISSFNQYLNAKNLNPTWINVQAIYDHFGYGNKTPNAIKKFIAHINTTNNLEYVLFVGGDSYDYHDNLNIGSVSHLPSWYATTNHSIHFTPTDVPYVDLDDNGYPDLAIGRWAVKTEEELNAIINNTLNFTKNGVTETLKISENQGISENISYETQLSTLLNLFPTKETVSISLDQLMVEQNTINPHDVIPTAQSKMLSEINNGSDLILFSGHGSPTAWTFYGLLSPAVTESISSDGSSFYFPLACYTTYFVEPSTYSLAHQLSYGGANGSSGIVGATTLSNYGHNEIIAQYILEDLNKGISLGKATLNAKNKLNLDQFQDVILNWATLAEPSMQFK